MIELGTWASVAARVRGDRRALGAVMVGYPAWQGVVRSARALDHLVAPGQRGQPIRAPVFIVGHPRSGTTFLHRLLATNPYFSTASAWQLLLPSVTLYRAVERARRANLAAGLANRLEHRLFDAWRDHHDTRWDAPEEDDWLLLHAVASPTLAFLTGDPDLSRRYWLGDALPQAERRRLLRWVRRSAQRHLYATDPAATWLSKNPHFAGWMRTLHRAFPDASFVMVERDPDHAIASRLRLLTGAWGLAPADARADPRVRRAFEASCALYRHAERVWPELPAERKIRVAYADLVRDPEEVIKRLHSYFSWPVGPAGPLTELVAEARRRVPRVPARLRHFGIAPDALARELAR